MIASASWSRPPLVLRERRADLRTAPAHEVVGHILRARYGTASNVPSEGLLSFQRDATARAHDILERRGGVLIADSVGLGKTHVALALLAPAFRAGARVAVVGPAGLRRQWRTAARAADRFEWISYSRLARRPTTAAAVDCVVFDEAHALRNPDTKRYSAARTLCRGARVVLLSATPINNSIWDLYHLLRLFAGDRDFMDVGVPSLHGAFAEAEATALLGSSPALEPVLREVMIRRTRQVIAADVTLAANATWRFPAREPPRPVYYAFPRKDGVDLLDVVGGALPELEFPLHGHAGGSAPAPAELMRRSLLKRLESSTRAFAASLASYAALLDRARDALRCGRVVRAGDRPARASDDAQLAFDELLFDPAPAVVARALAAGVAQERRVVERMLDAIAPEPDPKLLALRDLLARLAGRRVIVFTQFRDTARYLYERLARVHRVALIDGAGALLGGAVVDRATVVRRFAPAANGATAPPPHGIVDVLVATDVLSEGFNLQDASAVVSYDLPWNPVRLLQRVGRVDRLGSPHRSVSSYHFLPGDVDRYLGLVDRIVRKTATIEATIGTDAPLLHVGLVRAIERRDEDALARIAAEDGAFALDERMRALLSRLPHRRPDEHVAIPVACVRSSGDGESVRPVTGVVAAEVGGRSEWLAVRAGVATRDERWCADRLEAAVEPTCAADADRPLEAPPVAAIEALLGAARTEIARVEATIAAAPLLPPGGSAARIARRILGLAAALPGGPDAPLCARIERCLGALAAEPVARVPLPPQGAAAPARQLAALLDAIEPLADRAPDARSVPAERPVRIVGALLFEPPAR